MVNIYLKYFGPFYLNITKCKFKFTKVCIKIVKYLTRKTEINDTIFLNNLHKLPGP